MKAVTVEFAASDTDPARPAGVIVAASADLGINDASCATDSDV
jgi:hypothetical protein